VKERGAALGQSYKPKCDNRAMLAKKLLKPLPYIFQVLENTNEEKR